MNKLITKQANIIINSLNATHNNSATMMLHDLKNIMTSEFGFLKSIIDGALIGHDALLRQYTKRMILQMGAETNLIFKELFAAADRNTIQNRDVIYRAYQRIALVSNELRTNTDSLKLISSTWKNTFRREIQFSENILIRILGINKEEQESVILSNPTMNRRQSASNYQTYITRKQTIRKHA
jgi:hypothetical protein